MRNELIAFFEQKTGKKLTIEFSETFQLSMRQDSLKQLSVQSPPPTSQNLPLIIKRYDFLDTFSHFVHHSSNETFEIDGPHVRTKYIFNEIIIFSGSRIGINQE